MEKKNTFTLIYMNLVQQYNHTKTLASKTIHILNETKEGISLETPQQNFWIEIILQFSSGAKLSIMVVDDDKSFIVSGILLTHTFLHHSKFFLMFFFFLFMSNLVSHSYFLEYNYTLG